MVIATTHAAICAALFVVVAVLDRRHHGAGKPLTDKGAIILLIFYALAYLLSTLLFLFAFTGVY